MNFTTKLWIFNLIVWGGLIFSFWYGKNKERLKTNYAERNLAKAGNTLRLDSEAVAAFLSRDDVIDDEEKAAKDFLLDVHSLLMESVWTINSQIAELKIRNRTQDRIFAIRATYDLFIADKVFYTVDFTRTDIPANAEIKISEKISNAYYSKKAEIKTPKESFFKTTYPETAGKCRKYEIQIDEKHYLYNNRIVREVAGEPPTIKINNYEELKIASKTLDDQTAEYAKSIIEVLDKAIQYGRKNDVAKAKVDDFIGKYISTVVEAISSYSLDKTEESASNLSKTLRIMDTATQNFYDKLIASDLEQSDVNQSVLEQQLIREGLYNPYEDE